MKHLTNIELEKLTRIKKITIKIKEMPQMERNGLKLK